MHELSRRGSFATLTLPETPARRDSVRIDSIKPTSTPATTEKKETDDDKDDKEDENPDNDEP